jgi:hypothetical protein
MRHRIALPLAACLALSVTATAGAVVKTELDRGLKAIEAGNPVPVSNRPMDHSRNLSNRVFGRSHAPELARSEEFTPPEEFGVLFEYAGSRAELEAAGLRVGTQAGNRFTARVRRDEIGLLKTIGGLRNVQLARYVQPHLNLSIPDVRADLEHAAVGTPPVYTGHAGNGLIIGDVDTGIDFTRPDFSDGSGKTRILAIWDQTDNVGPHPSGFSYGSEWTKSDIDNAPGSVRERDTFGHGTLVCGVLAGNGSITGCSKPAYRFVGVAPLAQLVQVKTDFSDASIIDGVNYVFQRAAALGKDCVVNLSLGGQFGPHDGSGDFAASISALTGPGRIVVASAGNDQGLPIHGRMTTTSTTPGVDRFTFSVPTYTPAAGTFNDYVVVTGWYELGASYTIRVRGPSAADTLSVGFGGTKDKNLTVSAGKGGKLFIANMNAFYGFNGTTKARQFEVQVYDSLSTSAPRNGTWSIDVVSNGAGSVGKRVDMWVYASTFGNSQLEASVVLGLDNTTLVGSPADGDSVFAVAAHSTKASWVSCSSGNCGYVTPPTVGDIASFSCVGPRRDGVLKPEISAPGFGVASTHSTQAPAMGVCADADDGQHEITQGTSFSAPHVSGAAALFLETSPGASPSLVKQSFEAHARTDGFTGAVPNTTWGYGKLDIYATIDHVAPTASMLSPNGGESWIAGSQHDVTWAADDNNYVTTVDLALSADGGATFPNSIASGVPNTGTYTWTVPALNTTTARVRVTAHDAAGNSGSGASAGNFTIGPDALPSVAVTYPNGGENLSVGSNADITWTASDDQSVQSVSVELSRDNGVNWESIAADIPNTGTYSWLVTPPGTNSDSNPVYSALIRVTAKDNAAQTNADVSDAGFSIFGSPLAVNGPGVPTEFALGPIHPNPTHDAALLDFALPRAASVKLSVVDLQGREVSVLAHGDYAPGRYQVGWDGRSGHGTAQPGLYFVVYQSPGRKIVERLVLAR